MGEIVRFPVQKQDSIGPIRKKMIRARCKECGNTDKFYGKAIVHPFIIIEKQMELLYDVTEVGYRDPVDEIIEACASCGSREIDIEIIQKDVK